MCVDPVTAAIALGASGLGNYMQQKENNDNVNRQYNARNAVAQQGVAQQDADAAKSGAILHNTINQFSTPAQAQDLGSLVTARQNTINNNVTTPSALVDPTTNAGEPQVVKSDLADKMAKASAYSTQQGNALGVIGGTGDQTLQNNINLNTSGQKIGQESNFAKGDYGVNQAQQKSAFENARKAPNPLWGMLSQAGNLAGMYAAGGGDIGSLITGTPKGAMSDAAFNDYLNTNASKSALSSPYSAYDAGV